MERGWALHNCTRAFGKENYKIVKISNISISLRRSKAGLSLQDGLKQYMPKVGSCLRCVSATDASASELINGNQTHSST